MDLSHISVFRSIENGELRGPFKDNADEDTEFDDDEQEDVNGVDSEQKVEDENGENAGNGSPLVDIDVI